MSGFLGRLRPFAKALVPAVLGALSVPISWVATGDFDLGSFRLAVAGVLTAAVVYWVPNRPATS